MEQRYKDVKIDYDKVSEVAGHEANKGVCVVDAANDIFSSVKEKAMQLAIKGEFIEFSTVEQLQDKLAGAAQDGFSIRIYDEDIGG